jgi:hypothetical protein
MATRKQIAQSTITDLLAAACAATGRMMDIRYVSGNGFEILDSKGRAFSPQMKASQLVTHLQAMIDAHTEPVQGTRKRNNNNNKQATHSMIINCATPEALEQTVETMRLWMIENGVACTTFLPGEFNGFTAAAASDLMWDAASEAVDRTTFDCMVKFKDTALPARSRTMSLVPCIVDADGDPVDENDDGNLFFYFDGTQLESEIRAAYSKANSPEEWYIA